jgi:hypothetical protein
LQRRNALVALEDSEEISERMEDLMRVPTHYRAHARVYWLVGRGNIHFTGAPLSGYLAEGSAGEGSERDGAPAVRDATYISLENDIVSTPVVGGPAPEVEPSETDKQPSHGCVKPASAARRLIGRGR